MGLFDFLKPKRKKPPKKLPEEKPRQVVHLFGPDTVPVFVIDQTVLGGIKVGQDFEVKLSHLPTTIRHPTESFVWNSAKDKGGSVPLLYEGRPFGNMPDMRGMVPKMFKQYKTLRATATITRWKFRDEYPTVVVKVPSQEDCYAFVDVSEKIGNKYAELGCRLHYLTIPEKCATDKIKTQCSPKPLTVTIGEANEGHRPPAMVAIGKTMYFRVHARCNDYEFLVGLVGRTDCMATYEAVEKESGGYKYRLYVATGCNIPE